MAMKKAFISRTYTKYKECTPGQILINDGIYKKSEIGGYDKLNHIFGVEGGEAVLNSANKLNYLVENFLTPGMKCRVVYVGKFIVTKGKYQGKEAHDFELFVDDSEEGLVAPDEDIIRADTSSLPEMSI